MDRSQDIRLFPRRWDMHVLQALSAQDHATLRRVFVELDGKIPPHAVDTQVQTFGYGAPMQFCSYGFFDRSVSGLPSESKMLFDRAVQGDSLLLLALRHHDPKSAVVLLRAGGSLDLANSLNETPFGMIYAAFALFQLRERGSSLLPRGIDGKIVDCILSLSTEYATLFLELGSRLAAHHDAKTRSTREALTQLYSELAPDRVAKVDAQLREFEFREEELLSSVREKYGV